MTACREANLYAPVHPDAWLQIRSDLQAENADPGTVIVSAYGPGGLGFDALCDELLTRFRCRPEVRSVLDVSGPQLSASGANAYPFWRSAPDERGGADPDHHADRIVQAQSGQLQHEEKDDLRARRRAGTAIRVSRS